MADKIRVLLSEEEVNQKISEIAEQISRDYEGKELHLICILKGGVFFTCELRSASPYRYPWTLCRCPATGTIPGPAGLSASSRT